MDKNPAAVALGKRSWKKRKSKKEIARLREIGRKGAAARWGKVRKLTISIQGRPVEIVDIGTGR